MLSHPTGPDHGGDLAAARRLFPDAPEPFIDLSTGINPHAFALPPLRAEIFWRLPTPGALARLASVAAAAYGALAADNVVPAPGTQILLPLVAALRPPGRAIVLGPTYKEHARAAVLAGHAVTDTATPDGLATADLAVVVNPNNPDGRLLGKPELLGLAETIGRRGGLLVVDEAFMDVGPPDASLAADVERGNIVVLRSFGKFFGLAGVRLGFALTAPELAVRLAAWLGPWAVSGPAIAAGEAALSDAAWASGMRLRLASNAHRLDGTLRKGGLDIAGGTSLFRLAITPAAEALFSHLGRSGIWVRRFAEHPGWLRFGLPPDEAAWARLENALASFGR